MPELPEVQCVVDTLRPEVVDRTIVRVKLNRADIVEPATINLAALIKRRRIIDLHRRAKRIVFTLDDANRFYIHLGMTGRLTTESPKVELKPHTHLRLDLDTGRQLRFVDPRRFGGVHWLGDGPHDVDIGPEPLSIRATTLAKQLAGTTRAVKTALLDQRLIAGIGNIYADESLWGAGVHPLTPGDKLTEWQIAKLTRSMKAVLRRAINSGGSSLRDYVNGRGERGDFQRYHRVYDRAGEPCLKCKSPIERIVLGGRSTHFCPACQAR